MIHHRFGHPSQFAIEIGPPTSQLREVDLWAAGVLLTCDDDLAYLPTFSWSMEATLTWLLKDHDRSLPYPELSPEENHRRLQLGEYEDRERFFFLNWGPTTDNVLALLFRRGTDLILTFEFWRPTHPRPEEIGKVFVVEMPERDLLRCLLQSLCTLLREAKTG